MGRAQLIKRRGINRQEANSVLQGLGQLLHNFDVLIQLEILFQFFHGLVERITVWGPHAAAAVAAAVIEAVAAAAVLEAVAAAAAWLDFHVSFQLWQRLEDNIIADTWQLVQPM